MSATHYVYTLWSENDVPLYVGCSTNVDQRVESHRYSKPWFEHVARVEVDETTYTSRSEGEAAEAERIKKLLPWHNVQHHWNKGRTPLGAESARTAEVLVYLRSANECSPEGSFAAWLWERRDHNWRGLNEEWAEDSNGLLPLNPRMVSALSDLLGHTVKFRRERMMGNAERSAA